MFFRLFVVLKEFISLTIFYYSTPVDERKTEKVGKRIRLTFERLGATYIKLGQILSMRPDFIPEEYCIELEHLLDSAPAISTKEIKRSISKEFGKPVEKIFKDFEEKSLAAASLSQIHQATLFSGEKVIVKILRPGVRKLIKQDLKCIKLFMHLFGGVIFDEKAHFVNLVGILNEWLERETDYEKELNNMLIMKEELKDTDIKIPKVYKQISTKGVLVMDYIEGYSVLEIIRLKRKGKLPDFSFSLQELMENLIKEMGLNSLYRGHFHADLHPANIIIKPDGTIYLIDFGLIQYFNKMVRKNITLFMTGMSLCSPELIIFACKKLAVFSPKYNEKKVYVILNEVCDAYRNAPASKMSNGQFLLKIFNIGLKNGVTFDWTLVLYTRSAMHLDGMVLNLCPEFVFSNYARGKFLKIYSDIALKEVISIPNLIEKADDIIEAFKKFSFSATN